jgi:hypothetical protein
MIIRVVRLGTWTCLWQCARNWADTPIHNRRRRRCGHGPEHVSLSLLTGRKLRVEIMGLAARLSHLCPSALRWSPCTCRAEGTEV